MFFKKKFLSFVLFFALTSCISKYQEPAKPFIFENKIYAITSNGKLEVREINNFKNEVLSKKIFTEFKNINASVVVDSDTIFTHNGKNEIKALNANDLSKKWSRKISSIVNTEIVFNDKDIFFITEDNKTYALNKDTGEINWIHSSASQNVVLAGGSSPVLYKDFVISAYSNGDIYYLSQEKGEEKNYINIVNPDSKHSNFAFFDIDPQMILDNNILYLSGNNDFFTAVDLKNFRIKWQKDYATNANFLIDNDKIYIIDTLNTLYCLSITNGEEIWSKVMQNKIYYRDIQKFEDKLLITTTDKKLLLVSMKNGDVLKEKAIAKVHSEPVVTKEKVFINTNSILTNDIKNIKF